jgi:ribosomal protein S18 acetylase RimI-like enzyme
LEESTQISTEGSSMSLPLTSDSISYRPLRKGEEKEAAVVLAHAYEFDPRFYYWTFKVEAETRFKITLKLMEAVVNGAVTQKACWVATALDRIVGVMIVMSPDDKKRPPMGVLLQSGWKLLKHTKLLLPGMKMYGTAMKEVDRVFPNQNSEWFLVNVGILPQYQGHGVGDGMIRMVMKWADQQQARVNSLVFHHRQVAFLERYGFAVVSQQDADKQPSFFTLVREPKEKGKVAISARTSMTFDSSVSSRAAQVSLSRDSVAEEESADGNDNNMDIVDL